MLPSSRRVQSKRFETAILRTLVLDANDSHIWVESGDGKYLLEENGVQEQACYAGAVDFLRP